MAVTAVDTQGVQFQQFPGEVLVDATQSVAFVVQIAQHGRVVDDGCQQITKPAQCPWADGLVFIVRQHRPDVALVLKDAEVIHPEPGHLLLDLVG